MGRNCPDCGKERERLSIHILQGSCEYPSFNGRQHEILTGLVMGDGSVTLDPNGRNPYLKVKSIEYDFLEWLKEEFSGWSREISREYTAEESAEQARSNGLDPDAKAENYSDVYNFHINCHPELHEYNDWYSSGTIKYPDDLSLTPLTTKVWYCSDGSLRQWKDDRPSAYFTTKNENHRGDFLEKLFNDIGFESLMSGDHLRLGVDETEQLMKWMGPPLPGFDYKWC